MQAVILTIHLLIALALILVVLMQRSEGGGLGIGGGGGGIMTSRGAATALSKVTWALGIAFVVTSLTLTVLAAHGSRSGSVLDTLGVGTTPAPATTETPATGTPIAPDLQGDLLPKMPAATDQAPAQAPANAAPATETPAAPPPAK
ncbi:MAG: preprotein translocase subunit SecG [Amaricoccus sp.]